MTNEEGPPTDDDDGPFRGVVQLDASPVDAVVLRETADGWVDIDATSYQPSGGRDLPRTTPNTRAFVLDAEGTGLALGGIAGTQTDPRGRDRVAANASARRLEHGGAPPSTPPAFEAAEPGTLAPDAVRLAIGGHPACLDRCTGGGGQGLTPDVHLSAAAARVKTMAAAGVGPSALLVGGGRASLGGEPLDEAGARRYRELVEGADVPTYVLPGPGDLVGGGDEAFASAFADAAAPQGTGATPEGVEDGAITPFEGAGERVFAFDLRAAAGTVRVVAIDNAAGRLAGGPDGPQAQWLREVMDGARTRGIPVVVVGSASLDGAQLMPRADDAEEELALLVGHASAYVATAGVDDPADPHFGGVLSRTEISRPNAAATLAVFQSSTLGYSPARSPWQIEDDYDEAEFNRQTSAALLMLDVAVGRYDAGTGVAPVTAMSEPLVETLALDSSLRTNPVGFALPLGVAAADPAPLRFLLREEDERAVRAGQRLQRGLPPAAPMRAVVVVLRQRRADRHRVHLVEPAGRAVRRGPARPHLRGSGEARDRPGRRGTRRRRPARRVLPAGARNHGGDGDDGGAARLLDDRGRADVGAAASARGARHPDRARDVRLPRLRGARAPQGSARRGARGARAGAATHSGADRPATGTRPQSRAGTAAAAADRPAGAATAARRTRGARAAREPAARRPGAPARRAGGQAPGARGTAWHSRPASRSSPRPRPRCRRSRRPRCSSSAVARRRSRPTAPPWPTRTRLRRCRGSCSAAARCSRWRSRADR